MISGDTSAIAAAAAAARTADRAVVTVGDLSGLFLTGTVGEGSDVASLRLPGVQQELIDAVLDTGTPTVVVVASGRPYDLGRATTEAAAIVQAWLPGQEGAAAIASVLYGETVPGGKLSISIPKRAGALPYFYNHKFKSPGTPIQGAFGASFPFGHGLSYTTFELIDVSLGPTTVASDGEIVVECTVTNCGDRDGDEVVQVYVRDLVASLARPVMELKGFRRVHVGAGDRARIRIEIPTDLLSFTGRDGRRVLEPGDFEVLVGTSSRAIAERARIHVSGPPRILEGAWRMESRSEVVAGGAVS
jgi:beta-glucosidase